MADAITTTDDGGAAAAAPPLTTEDLDLLSGFDVEDEAGTGDGKTEEVVDEGKGEKVVEEGKKGAAGKDGKDDKGAAAAATWLDSITDKAHRELAGGFKSQEELLSTIGSIQKSLGVEPGVDWRKTIQDEKLRDHAGRFASPTDLAKAHLDLRNQLSAALVPPGKNATKEERAAFAARLDKALGVPADHTGYAFPAPKEGEELTDLQKAGREDWAKFFHSIHLPKRMADAILGKFTEDSASGLEKVKEEDERYAEASVLALQREWGDDYQPNRTLALRTAQKLFGDDLDGVMSATMSNNRLLMDSPFMLRMLAKIGREMDEGGVEDMTEKERETLDDQVKDLRKRSEAAKVEGNTRLANKLFQQEQELLGKIHGRRPIVGAAGRSI